MERSVPHSLVQALRRIPDFSPLDERTLLSIAGESMNLFWKAGSYVFKVGEPGEALYVVLSGEVSIYRGDDPRDEVAHPQEGESFGELSLLLNATHSMTAVALTDSEILVLPKEAFTRLLKENPALAQHFDDILQARQARMSFRG